MMNENLLINRMVHGEKLTLTHNPNRVYKLGNEELNEETVSIVLKLERERRLVRYKTTTNAKKIHFQFIR